MSSIWNKLKLLGTCGLIWGLTILYGGKDPFYGMYDNLFLWTTGSSPSRPDEIESLEEKLELFEEAGVGTIRIPAVWKYLQINKQNANFEDERYQGYVDADGYPRPNTSGVYTPDPNGYYMPKESENLIGSSPYQLKFVNLNHLKNLDTIIASVPDDVEIILNVEVGDCPLWIKQFFNFNPSIYTDHLVRFAEFLANRYKGRVRTWMVGGEVDNQSNVNTLVAPPSWWNQDSGWDGWLFSDFVLVPSKQAIQSIDPTSTVTASLSTNGSLGIYYRWDSDFGPLWEDNWSSNGEESRVMFRPNFLHEMFNFAGQNNISAENLFDVLAIHPYYWWSYNKLDENLSYFHPRALTYGNEEYPEMHDGVNWYPPVMGTAWDDAYADSTDLANYPADQSVASNRPKIIVTPENWGGQGPQSSTDVLENHEIDFKPIWWTEFTADDQGLIQNEDPILSWQRRSIERAQGLEGIYTDAIEHELRYHIRYPLERMIWWYSKDVSNRPVGLVGDRELDPVNQLAEENEKKPVFYALRNIVMGQGSVDLIKDDFSNIYEDFGRSVVYNNIDEDVWDTTTIIGGVSVDLNNSEMIFTPPATSWGKAGISLRNALYYDDPVEMKKLSFKISAKNQSGEAILGMISIGNEPLSSSIKWTNVDGFLISFRVKEDNTNSVILNYLHIFNYKDGGYERLYHYNNSAGLVVPDKKITFAFNEKGNWKLSFGDDEILPSSGTYLQPMNNYPFKEFKGEIDVRVDVMNNGSDGSGRGARIV